MNTHQPIASSIRGVEFGSLSAEDIRALSVKKINNPTTFDSLLHPVPGGLYDRALGAWGDHLCTTCGLSTYQCPGHSGHMELPVPVYHPTFMDQALQLLRGKCSYCHRFRMSRVELNGFVCKLRLIQYGLVNEADRIDDFSLSGKSSRPKAGEGPGDVVDSSSDSDMSAEGLLAKRNLYVKRKIRQHVTPGSRSGWRTERNEVTIQKRRAVVKDFFVASVRSRKCVNCNGISPTFRKDRYVKIFEKGLSRRDHLAMVQGGFKQTNALVIVDRQRKSEQNTKTKRLDEDEGIVADLDEEMEDEVMHDDAGPDLVSESANQTSDATTTDSASQRYVNAGEVHAALTLLVERETEILNLVYNPSASRKSASPFTADMFFIRFLLVPPNRYRPEVHQGAGAVVEAQQNNLYKAILTQCENLNEIHRELTNLDPNGAAPETRARVRTVDDLQESWVRLQDAVNSLLDKDRNPLQGAAAQRADDGIKQKLEKKEGLFRKNMMGKRVNFAARSVISPDPNIGTHQIGVPPIFAEKLTYPEPVTSYNVARLSKAICNGPGKWPGAAAIENENGQVTSLKNKTTDELQALAHQLLADSTTFTSRGKNKKVYRHLNNDDIVLMNRQPTLHKPSIMAHRVKVLPGEKTIRMHYSNCQTYNADFDGDEMNLHFPQNEIARAEAQQIADTDHQYLSATAGKPLRGLVQDHISMGVWMTNKDSFFSREEYQQLVYGCLRPENEGIGEDVSSPVVSGKIRTVEPAVLRPRRLWTGKQIITTVLINIRPSEEYEPICITSKSGTPAEMWGEHSEEADVVFDGGEFISGILDKGQIGAAPNGLVHSVYEAWGHTAAGTFLSVLGRLLTAFLNMRAFSCGMEDLVLTQAGEELRRGKLQEVGRIGDEVARKYVKLDEERASGEELRSRLESVLRDDEKQSGLDRVMNARAQALSSDVSTCLPSGLRKQFPANQMQTMTKSGAKGTSVNANLISCNLGQQVLEGRRVPTMVSGKTLPCFSAYETDPRAGGYITDRFLTGIRPQEYFFHSMAGREGLIDTAVKTSRSGYLQRCLIKGMEGLKVEYDDTVRDVDGSMVVQFLYGEDGLEVTKQKLLTDFKFSAKNHVSLKQRVEMHVNAKHLRENWPEAQKLNKAVLKKVKKSGGRVDAVDPVLAHFSPSRYLGATSEAFYLAVREYVETNPDKLITDEKRGVPGVISRSQFETLQNLRYLRATVEPGEAVGIVAGQSIGEPSTQMTLNTFHLAGHSGKNVTLGIPRLREIVMTASASISTPLMTLRLNPELTEREGQMFAKAISKLSLADVVDSVTVREALGVGKGYAQAKTYVFDLTLYPAREYTEEYGITVSDVARTLERQFVPRLQRIMRAELKKKQEEQALGEASSSDSVPQVGRAGTRQTQAGQGRETHPAANDEDGDDDGDDDEDATSAKRRGNGAEGVSYAGPDEDEAAIAQGRETPEGSPPPQEELEEGGRENDEEESEDTGESETDERESSSKQREVRVKERSTDVVSFLFDETTGDRCQVTLEYPSSTAKLLTLPIIIAACRGSIIQSVPGLDSCVYSQAKQPGGGSVAVIQTTGVNLPAMHQHTDIIDPTTLATNDIASFLRHYGVEACRGAIVREMDTVFKGHGINVDGRHLNLIADMMTRGGGYEAFNRLALKSNPSPLLKMSFETTVSFLRDAVLEADFDDLRSPSSRIVVGKMGGVGTGGVDVLMPV